MIRTQIQLTPEQARLLKQAAAARGVSMATLIREAVDRSLTQGDPASARKRAAASVGGFRSGLKDVSEHHDRYLDEALAE